MIILMIRIGLLLPAHRRAHRRRDAGRRRPELPAHCAGAPAGPRRPRPRLRQVHARGAGPHPGHLDEQRRDTGPGLQWQGRRRPAGAHALGAGGLPASALDVVCN